MQSDNFVIQHTLKFLGNTGDFDTQPIFLLSNNNSLTGNNFINLSRIRSSTADGASGSLILTVADNNRINSRTNNSIRIFAQSLTSNGLTSDSSSYTISTNMNQGNIIDVILDINEILLGAFSLSGFDQLGDLNTLTMNGRPEPDADLAGYWTFNREELGTSITAVADRSGKGLTGAFSSDIQGDATTATVTGWSFGPCEGAFRFRGRESHIVTDYSQDLNLNSTSGATYMTFFKLNSITSSTSQHVPMAAASGTEDFAFQISFTNNFGLTVMHKANDVTARHNLINAGNFELGKWYHIALTHSLSGSNSGTYVYLNGLSASFTATPVMNINKGMRVSWGNNPQLGIFAGGTQPVTGSVGMTRIWTRALSAQEIYQNFLGTIPNMVELESIKIG